MDPLDIRIAGNLGDRVRIAAVAAGPVRVGPSSARLSAEIESTARELAGRFRGRAPAAIPQLGPARELYRAFGVDPTKTRPSSESLLRRILRDAPFPSISNAVDLANLLAVRFLLPIGLYDVDRLSGPVVLRTGFAREGYDGIRKDRVHVTDRLVLADDRGAFGNPTSDSLRTSVRDTTVRLLLVLFAPGRIPAEEMARKAMETSASLARHLGAGTTPVETRWSVCPDTVQGMASCPEANGAGQ